MVWFWLIIFDKIFKDNKEIKVFIHNARKSIFMGFWVCMEISAPRDKLFWLFLTTEKPVRTSNSWVMKDTYIKSFVSNYWFKWESYQLHVCRDVCMFEIGPWI